jgi:hypothetical protein
LDNGRPRALNEAREDELVEWLKFRVEDSDSPTVLEFERKVIELMNKTLRDRNEPDLVTYVSRSTLRRLRSSNRIRQVLGQKKTEARTAAERSVRMAVSMAVMCNAWKDIDPHLKINFDATLIDIAEDERGKLLVAVRPTGSDKPIEGKKAGGLAYYVKLFHITNAMGKTWKPVILVADDKMEPENLIWHEVNGLSGVDSSDGKGVLAFTKDRSANKQFFRKYFLEIVCPFVQEQQRLYNLTVCVAVLVFILLNMNFITRTKMGTHYLPLLVLMVNKYNSLSRWKKKYHNYYPRTLYW